MRVVWAVNEEWEADDSGREERMLRDMNLLVLCSASRTGSGVQR